MALGAIIAVEDAASESRICAIVDIHSSTSRCSVAVECAVESRQGPVNEDCTTGVTIVALESTGVDLDVCTVDVAVSMNCTATGSSVALKSAGVDLECTTSSNNSPAPVKIFSGVALEDAGEDLHVGTTGKKYSAMIGSSVALKCAVINLQITFIDPNSPPPSSAVTLKSACVDLEICANICKNCTTIYWRSVALENASVDLDICAINNTDCSALLSWMSRPGTWKKVQEISVSWFSRMILG
jgi:hypothetical protein